MLQWINPLKWWRIFQIKRRWRRASLQFVHFYHRQDLAAAESAAKLMVNILSESGLKSLLLDSYYSLMLCYWRMERFDEAIAPAESVLELQSSLAVNLDDRRVPERMGDLANLYNLAGRVDDAIKLYGQALVTRRRIDGGKGSKQFVNILECLAAIYVDQEQGEKALQLFDEAQGYRSKLGLLNDNNFNELERVIKRIRAHYRGENRADFEQWQNLTRQVVKLRETGDISGAILISEQALALAEKIFPIVYNDLAVSFNDLALLYESQNRLAEAEPLYFKALEVRKKLFPERSKPHYDLAVSFNNLARLYESQGRLTEAEPLRIQALEIRKKLFPESKEFQ
jgi:tetratricopeptide (TPR) repeat protein